MTYGHGSKDHFMELAHEFLKLRREREQQFEDRVVDENNKVKKGVKSVKGVYSSIAVPSLQAVVEKFDEICHHFLEPHYPEMANNFGPFKEKFKDVMAEVQDQRDLDELYVLWFVDKYHE